MKHTFFIGVLCMGLFAGSCRKKQEEIQVIMFPRVNCTSPADEAVFKSGGKIPVMAEIETIGIIDSLRYEFWADTSAVFSRTIAVNRNTSYTLTDTAVVHVSKDIKAQLLMTVFHSNAEKTRRGGTLFYLKSFFVKK